MKTKKIALVALLTLGLVGCGLFNRGPEATVKSFYHAVEDGKFDDAIDLLSAKVKAMGKDKLRAGLAEMTREMKGKGGVKSLDITKMDVTGDMADGQIKIEFGNGTSKTDAIKLIKEDGAWKLDAGK